MKNQNSHWKINDFAENSKFHWKKTSDFHEKSNSPWKINDFPEKSIIPLKKPRIFEKNKKSLWKRRQIFRNNQKPRRKNEWFAKKNQKFSLKKPPIFLRVTDIECPCARIAPSRLWTKFDQLLFNSRIEVKPHRRKRGCPRRASRGTPAHLHFTSRPPLQLHAGVLSPYWVNC